MDVLPPMVRRNPGTGEMSAVGNKSEMSGVVVSIVKCVLNWPSGTISFLVKTLACHVPCIASMYMASRYGWDRTVMECAV